MEKQQHADDRYAYPTAEHIAIWRKETRLMSDEELHVMRNDHEWLVVLADTERDDWPPPVTLNSLVNARAVIGAVNRELAWRQGKGVSKPVSHLGWPPEFIAAVKSRVSIEEEVSRHVALRRQGKGLVGTCPFHPDRTPSFMVWPDDGRFRCFGCQKAGDIITWQQAIGGMTFQEAVVYLSDRAEMDVPKTRCHTKTSAGQYWV